MEADDSARLTYIASPYTHKNKVVENLRFDACVLFTASLFKKGVFAFSPIVHCHPLARAVDLPGEFSFWEMYDEAMIARCDELCVLQLPGWRDSRGVREEVRIAERSRMRVWYADPRDLGGMGGILAQMDTLLTRRVARTGGACCEQGGQG